MCSITQFFKQTATAPRTDPLSVVYMKRVSFVVVVAAVQLIIEPSICGTGRWLSGWRKL
jgi:hypothetical protein